MSEHYRSNEMNYIPMDMLEEPYLHNRSTLIILNIPHPLRPRQRNLLCKSLGTRSLAYSLSKILKLAHLFLKVPNSKVVCICQEMPNTRDMLPNIHFKLVHQMRSKSLQPHHPTLSTLESNHKEKKEKDSPQPDVPN